MAAGRRRFREIAAVVNRRPARGWSRDFCGANLKQLGNAIEGPGSNGSQDTILIDGEAVLRCSSHRMIELAVIEGSPFEGGFFDNWAVFANVRR
jgi:hypothetical protein